MKKLTVRLLILFLPFVALFAFPFIVLFASGELLPVTWVVYLQSNQKITLFGLAYSNPVSYYKLKSVLERKPKIMSLGTSRVMQFRDYMFRSSQSFYNAGGAVSRMDEFPVFLDHLPIRQQPELILIGLDQYFFNNNWIVNQDGRYQQKLASDGRDALGLILNNWRRVYSDYFDGRFKLLSLLRAFGRLEFGLNAIMKGRGFRVDGSYSYGASVKPNINERFVGGFDRIEKHGLHFEKGDQVSSETLRNLEQFLQKCSSRGIRVVGFLPPYPHAIYAKMASLTAEYAYMGKIARLVEPVFIRYGYTFRDFSDLAWLGGTDAETIDGLHGSEEAYLRITAALAEVDEPLRQIVTDRTILLEELSAVSAVEDSR
jgi:hypothetical protein